MWNRNEYKRLDEKDDDISGNESIPPLNAPQQTQRWLLHLSILLFTISLLLFLASYVILRKAWNPIEALRRVNTYTPVFSTLNLPFEFHIETVHGSLFNEPYSIYRADPSLEVDAAWNAVAAMPAFPISRADMERMNRNLSVSTKLPESWGYGSDTYLGILNNQHLIHCLNLLRQFAHYDHYFESEWGPMSKVPPKHAAHRSHCVGVLLDALRCQMSTGVFTYVWMDHQPYPFPDFNIERKCMNHDKVLEWQKKESIPDRLTGRLDLIPRPKGQPEVEALRQIKALKGWEPNGSFPQ